MDDTGAPLLARTQGDWLRHPRPRWWHRCEAAAIGVVAGLVVSRCACGAIKVGRGKWRQRNTRGCG